LRAEEAGRKGFWELIEYELTALHAMHIDDCAEACINLAESEKDVVAIIFLREYETLKDVLEALVKDYGIKGVKSVGA
jgi:nucleoside-diphosphate-sugar epimerase